MTRPIATRRRCVAAVGATLLVMAILTPHASAATTSTWTQQSPPTSPPVRFQPTMAYDAATSSVVLFGGGSSAGTLNDTWTWNGTTWTQHTPATSPSARSSAAMAYDQATGTVVLFGGGASGGSLGDTWTWNGSTWTHLSPATSPPARFAASMSYDAATGSVVLFGGNSAGSNYLNDTWTWNGATWTQQSPSTSPPAREGPDTAYDAATGTVVLFGGFGSSDLNDTWTWNGTTWVQQLPATAPPARQRAGFTYDSAIAEVVMFSGSSSLDDTWTWNGTTWSQELPTTSPPARGNAAMSFDAMTGDVVLFGGGSGGSQLNDTWTWRTAQAVTSMTESASPASVPSGSSDTLSSMGLPNGATGTVSFTSGSTALCSASVSGGSASCMTPTTLAPGNYPVTATYFGDGNYSGTTASGASFSVIAPGSAYVSLPSPQRLEDTRTDAKRLIAGGTVDVQVAGGSTGVPSSATAAVLNVTSVGNAGAGFLQAYPKGGATSASAVNFYYPNQLTQNLVTVPIDPSSGSITVLSSTPDDVVVDELGYYGPSSGGSTAGQYQALPPARICDTRSTGNPGCAGGQLISGGVLHLQVGGNGGVPSTGVAAVVINVTVADDTLAGFVQAYPFNSPRPTAPPTSNVNYNGQSSHYSGDPCGASAPAQSNCQIIANRVISAVDSSGGVNLFVNQGPADLIVDVNGYFTDATAATNRVFTPTAVTRLHDTRAAGDTIAPNSSLTLVLTGSSSVIANGASAAVLNITVDKTTSPSAGPGVGFLTVFPGPASAAGSPPLISDLNFAASSIVPDQVYATLAGDGSINIYNGSGSPIDVIVDAYGYFH